MNTNFSSLLRDSSLIEAYRSVHWSWEVRIISPAAGIAAAAADQGCVGPLGARWSPQRRVRRPRPQLKRPSCGWGGGGLGAAGLARGGPRGRCRPRAGAGARGSPPNGLCPAANWWRLSEPLHARDELLLLHARAGSGAAIRGWAAFNWG